MWGPTPTLTNKQRKIPIFNIQYPIFKEKSKVPHTNFTLELQYLLMDVIVINNSYHIYSKVNVGAGASQKSKKRKFQYSNKSFNIQQPIFKEKVSISKEKSKVKNKRYKIKQQVNHLLFFWFIGMLCLYSLI